MAEAVAQPRRPAQRFFCHRCNVEFEDVLQEYTCPYCSTGFIERLELDDTLSSTLDDEEYSDADMSNLEDGSHPEDSVEDSDDPTRANNVPGIPMINDIAFLMTGGRLRPGSGRRIEGGRSLLEQLVWMVGGGRAPVATAGAPFVLVGAPGDYVFGGEGLDAVVTQLLGQLENLGPPPLPREQIQAIPSEQVSAAHVDAGMACSVCWDNFTLGETVSRLECEHIFHPGCITPWLQLHATCPICRRSLLAAGAEQAEAPPTAAPPAPPAPAPDVFITPAASSTNTTQTEPRDSAPSGFGRVIVRRRRVAPPASSSSSSSGRGLWSTLTSQLASAADSASSLSSDGMYMDIDFD